jgi:hypothetical protein
VNGRLPLEADVPRTPGGDDGVDGDDAGAVAAAGEVAADDVAGVVCFDTC